MRILCEYYEKTHFIQAPAMREQQLSANIVKYPTASRKYNQTWTNCKTYLIHIYEYQKLYTSLTEYNQIQIELNNKIEILQYKLLNGGGGGMDDDLRDS